MPTVTTYTGCSPCCGDTFSGCCTADPLPSTVTVTVSAVGGCACMDGLTTTLTYNAMSGKWESLPYLVTSCTGDPVTFILECVDDQFYLVMSGRCVTGVGSFSVTADASSDCNPLSLVFNATVDGLCCTGAVTCTITA